VRKADEWYIISHMNRTLVSETTAKIGEEVLVKGWVNTRRDHGKIIFIDLRDKTGLVQVVFVDSQKAKELRPEWVVEVKGVVKQRPEKLINPRLGTGKIEIEAKELNILAKSEELPFDTGSEELNVSLPVLLDFRPLSLRHPRNRAVFKVQETIIASFREVLREESFTEIQVPTIVPSITEGGAQVFKIKYFDKEAFLAQSPQLYKQIMVGVFERVFTLAHAYRAEPSVTTRHVTEYVGLDAEMGFISSFEDIMDTVEKVIRRIFVNLEKENKEELSMFNATIPKLSSKIPRIKMREAQEIIFRRTGRDNRNEPDLEPEDEREICRYSMEEYGSELVFITHYPTKKRPFYTFPDPKDPEYTESFDLIGRGLEWVTGGRRINDYEMLVEHIKKWGNRPEDFEIYLQAFKYGMPPEGGFCLGAERITMQVLGLENVREASLFPRDMERIDLKLPKKEE
jgi:nondiscriminating aspartyl-tRNA synthetase